MGSLQEIGNTITCGEGIWGWGMREGDLVFKKVEALLNLTFCKNGALYLFRTPRAPK